jgi:drug/metabolite transporter (DMT)-like permease
MGSACGDAPRRSRALTAVTAFGYVACALIWSTTWFAIRVCIGPGGYPTYAAAAIRFVLAAIILATLAAMGLAGRGPHPGRPRRLVALSGVLCGLGYGLVYAGETRISGGLAAVIFGTLPLITALATYAAGTERPSPVTVAGFVVSLGGVAVIYGDRMDASADQGIGVSLVFASVCVCAGYNLILKRHASDTDPLANNLVFLGAAAVALSLFALLYERRLPPWPLPWAPTVALVYLAVLGSVVTFALYFYLLKRMSLTALSTLVFIEPVLAMLIDAVWEKEIRLTAPAYAGAAITLVGVAISLLLRPRKSVVAAARTRTRA